MSARRPCFLLYLNYPVMSSRYMIDFAPSFAAAIWVCLHLLFLHARTRYPAQVTIVIALLLTVSAWWLYQIVTTKIFPDTGGGTVARIQLKQTPGSSLAIDTESYTRETEDDFGIPFNLYRWKRPTGRTASLVVLFLSGAERLELELTPVNMKRMTEKDWDSVRVKIGLEELKRKSGSTTPQGRTLVFERDSPSTGPSQIEIAFIALTDAKASGGRSKFRLQRVTWSKKASR